MGGSFELTPDSARHILTQRGEVSGRAGAHLLPGGVSNTVVLVEDGPRRIVLKQALARLRVRDEWLADRSRVVREWEVMRALAPVLPAGRVPSLLFLDSRRFLYAMEAAPAGTADWKTRLLAGETNMATARQAGATLGLMARGTWRRPEFRERFSDAKAFDQLRTDPYYRTVAARHPRLRSSLADWIDVSSRRREAMVHGDWSPKNLLVGPEGILCIDFECAHYGDPSYDAGFMLNHLILKAFNRPELADRYLRLARVAFTWTLAMLPATALGWFEAASVRHLAFLMLARIDGKSPVEYLTDETDREAVRQLAFGLIESRAGTLQAAIGLSERAIRRLGTGHSPIRRPPS